MSRTRFFVLFLILLAAGPTLTFTQESRPQIARQPALEAPYFRITDLANQPVVDPEGDPVGLLKDAFISTAGLITHWTVSVENVPDVPDGDYVMPVSAVQVGLNGIVLDVPDRPADQDLVPAQRAKTSGTVAQDSIRAIELVTFDLVNEQGQSIGTIEDIVANLQTHEVVYTVIDFDVILGAGQKMFAVPFSDIWYSLARGTVTLYKVNARALEQNPGFSPEDWPEQADTDWNRPAP